MRKFALMLLCLALREARAESVAVVELFTSESCPNCPLADAYLAQLIERPKEERSAVIPLAFHVDYWGQGNQRDPLSSTVYEERQRFYKDVFRIDGPYAPQMVVNGFREFVGSLKDVGDASIKAALREKIRVWLALSARSNKDVVSIHFHAIGETKNVVFNVALVQKSVTVLDHHKEIKHQNVVRVFKTTTQPVDDMEIKSPVKSDRCFVTVYAQDKVTHKIIGASVAEIK